MSKINIDILCKTFVDALGWPYVLGKAEKGKVDCSGLFKYAFKQQKKDIQHSSNKIWRKYLSEKGSISDTKNKKCPVGNSLKSSQLKKGMAVFKWADREHPNYKDGQGDFHHIGLVVSVSPLRIIHASTVGYIVKEDSAIGMWNAWGYLKDADYISDDTTGATSTSAKSNDIPMTVRRGDKNETVKTLQAYLVAAGYALEVDGDFGPKTEDAVRRYQASKGLNVDGIVGPKTWEALR